MRSITLIPVVLTGLVLAAGPSRPKAQADAPKIESGWVKPNWLTELSAGAKESFDDNVLLVSGLGLPTQSSWLTTLSLRGSIDLRALFNAPSIRTFSLAYQPDRVWYAQASSEDYTAHRLALSFKQTADNLTIAVDNAFLYNDGNKFGATYALNQLSGAAGNQNDKYRNNYSQGTARERRAQSQDRYAISVQYDAGNAFVRAVSGLTLYKLDTYLFNTSLAPYKGYQDWVNRYDVNVGADLGYHLGKDLSLTLGYRDGYQSQAQFALPINSDQHFSSNHYDRVLLGLEGKLTRWLSLKLSVGPDYRDFNASAAVANLRSTHFYGDATATAILSPSQTLGFTFKQWVFVSSTGLVPYTDAAYALTYHRTLSHSLSLDLGAKYLESNYTLGNDFAGSAPSLRDDADYQGSGGITYALSARLSLSYTYTYDQERNELHGLAASLQPNYRNVSHTVDSVGLQYKF